MNDEHQKMIDDIKVEHPKLVHAEIDGRLYAFRKPKGIEFKRFLAQIEKKDSFFAASNLLIATMVIPPDGKQAAMQWLEEEYPGAVTEFGGELVEMARGTAQIQIEGN